MNIGIMTVNGFGFHPNARFREEAEKMGHRLWLIDPYKMGCVIKNGSPGWGVGNDAGDDDLPQVFDANWMPDLVMPRQGSPMGEYGFVLLRQWEALGVPLVNGIHGVTIARNQFISLQRLMAAGLPVPDSVFVTSRENFIRAVETLGGFPVVAKQVDGMGGEGVARIDTAQDASAYLDTDFNPLKGLVVQAYLDPRGRSDIRALVIGGRVAAAMSLTPVPGTFKANIHQQGRARAMALPPGLSRMAVAAAKACRLEIAGVDMMVGADLNPVVSEVNYSPGFRGLEAACGQNIARMILTHALNTGDHQ